MTREATGEVRFVGGIWTTRIRINGKRVPFDLPTCEDKDEAKARSKILVAIAKRFKSANVSEKDRDDALKAVAASSLRSLKVALAYCEELLGGELDDIGAPSAPTFKTLAEDFTDGNLRKLYPDHIKLKDWSLDKSRLMKLCAIDVGGQLLGDIRIDRVTLDHAETAMRHLPADAKRPATRRQYAQLIHRVLSLAVYPCRHITTNPLPKGFMPKAGKPPAYAYLYPSEDAALMACRFVPLAYRLLYGFLAREGLRISEAMGLAWKDLDLERGVITLDRNKTDDARAWALNAGVVRALKAWKERSTHAFVFADADGILDIDGIAERLRGDLKSANVTRSELHTDGENRGKFRVHDLRGTFVTLSLANGRSETWVADRTGHASSQMINRYRRAARSAQELELGELHPLDTALDWDGDCPTIAPNFVGQDRLELSANGLRVGMRPEPQHIDITRVRVDMRGGPFGTDVDNGGHEWTCIPVRRLSPAERRTAKTPNEQLSRLLARPPRKSGETLGSGAELTVRIGHAMRAANGNGFDNDVTDAMIGDGAVLDEVER